MNPSANLNHIVLKVRSFEDSVHFYCGFLGLENRSHQPRYLSVQISNFILNFVESNDFEPSWARGISHIGLEFSTRAGVDAWYSRFNTGADSLIVSAIAGGPGKGPYRFYAKDPSGYVLEFESWEGCSD